MNQYHYKFARRTGETPLRPDYANSIEHYKVPGQGAAYWFGIALTIVFIVSILFNLLSDVLK